MLSHPPAPTQVVANPSHLGWRCLRCGSAFDRTDLFEGCTRCAAEGHAANVQGRYGPGSVPVAAADGPGIYRWGTALPYLGGVSLGEANTPCVPLPDLAAPLQLDALWIKNESANPTGSHKDRMSALATTRALEIGATRVALASSGNAGVSAACYAAAAGLACDVAVYASLHPVQARLMQAAGARLHAFASGPDRWRFVERLVRDEGAFPLTNFVEPAVGSPPFGVEAYRSIAFEIAAQCEPMPRHIMVPTARGDLLWGLASGFEALLAAGRLRQMPRLWAVEPFERLAAVMSGADYRSAFHGRTAQASTAGHTVTWQAVRALGDSGGGAVAVDDAAARSAWIDLARAGWPAELCAAAALAGLRRLRERGDVLAGESALLVFTARADRDPALLEAPFDPIPTEPGVTR